MVNLVTVSTLEGNRVHREPKLVLLKTYQLYSRLISCTRRISTLPWELKCVCVCVFCVCLRVFVFFGLGAGGRGGGYLCRFGLKGGQKDKHNLEIPIFCRTPGSFRH